MRPAPRILHRWVDPTDVYADSLDVTATHEGGLYGVCLVGADGSREPISLRITAPMSGSHSYTNIAHAHPGHSCNLADRLNARFQMVPGRTGQWFASFRFEPTTPTPCAVDRKGGASSRGRRQINRPLP
jgi:hypothetical protein